MRTQCRGLMGHTAISLREEAAPLEQNIPGCRDGRAYFGKGGRSERHCRPREEFGRQESEGLSMDVPGYGITAMRRGSYDDATASIRPVSIEPSFNITLNGGAPPLNIAKATALKAQHFKHLAQRRRSAPSLVFGKALGMPWSSIREEASCWVSVEQSPFVLGLTSENGELLLEECVQVTESSKTKERHLFLFKDVIVFAKLKSNASYRLKHRVSLEDIWLYGFEDESEEEEGTMGGIDLRVTVVLAWAFTVCLVYFCSPEVKERWLDTLHRQIRVAKARIGCVSSPPRVLMKVLSGNITTKTLTGGGMEPFIECPVDGDPNISAQPKQLHNPEERPTQPVETKWKWLKKGTSFSRKARRSDADSKMQLFGQPLCKICPDDCSLPKPVTEMLLLLRKKGPSTEGVFRKPCNSKIMKDLREQLNSGLEVNLERQPVVLLVGLLKSFLKELPGSLLASELYDNWMTALDNEDTQQRAVEIRNVVDKLPAANKLLLQHLVCVLHHILESANINKMDAHNLAVCIAPTLLQLDGSPLDEQKERIEKVTELTQFLIEHCEILGENIPNLLDTDEDSLSSQHHDSAYDSTDPDGDGEAGESACSTHGGSGSSSSLSPSLSASSSSWPADASFNTKPPFNRRCSEPIIHLPADLERVCSHARSHDDCSVERSSFEEQPLKKQISDDSFLLRGARPVLMFPKLSSSSNMDPLPYMAGNHTQNCSCSSLESATSNQSDGSVFTSSPVGSPSCQRRANTSVATKSQQDIPRPISDEKKRSQSMRGATKALLRTRSLVTFNRSSLKKDSQKENAFPCETLPEDSQSETDPCTEPLRKSRPLSAIEVFKHMDSKLPCRPPTYEHAMQSVGLPPQYASMTVQDAKQLERRSRPSSVNYDFPSMYPASQYTDCFDQTSVVERRQPFRQRAMSESVSARHHEVVSRRCSQPVFEEFSYAKESYV
ncbi:T cell activation RhoGTPase activating protein b [Cheilinus undulatus]|uniref:T cell activation RhoGTPase activating protein b n=1 Tax=Cheilinus undulatus TaxID=241271 RepID=UPI001BD1D1B5|nr:T cell activation RhoGTPase activating protein b [Cheilinus undulatus]